MHPLFWVPADSHGDKRPPSHLQSVRARGSENSTGFSTTRMPTVASALQEQACLLLSKLCLRVCLHPGWELAEGRKQARQLPHLWGPEHKARSRVCTGPVGLRLTDAHSPSIL